MSEERLIAEKIHEQLVYTVQKLLAKGIKTHVIGICLVHVSIELAIEDGVSLESFHKYIDDVYKYTMARVGNYEEEI